MELLLTYDVDTTTPEGRRRLRRVAKLCEGHGIRVQKSVFEIITDDQTLLQLTYDIEDLINTETDSVRIYRLPPSGTETVQTLGAAAPHPHRSDLIL
ncbi:CRISPR-associated endonuclease Cas2 [Streptomyces diastaticus]|uniref:CRISPR-associated endoribonuclease Cas2 n=1 Tax=Streptomyces diastaticus subsp. diastaticus TaxID=68040 RepID=A0ABQ1CXZ8_STRDI|nr:CRISPR-associated endonuclease Cas2 [Streptomyces diastaticus]MBZ2410767.1 CRISPR-associated endonuclease Cas2 [Streptomyces sp. L06]GFH75192.1 CRISPR-associated endoribonuclease Cas2 [Streptomyces diastaticus subsp. diastaticus]GGU44052.1 CRISPR-associated endoribonuclease Cas2 [Streptomyces diastaticus subsp. diastaticus]